MNRIMGEWHTQEEVSAHLRPLPRGSDTLIQAGAADSRASAAAASPGDHQLLSASWNSLATTDGCGQDCGVEAIAIGHDLGRPPLGHVGETILSQLELARPVRCFGVSYGSMLRRLEEGGQLAPSEEFREVRPISMARSLGYPTSPYEFGVRPLPPEERLPRRFLELAYRAVRSGALSLRRVAELLGVSDLELEERLSPEEVEAIEEAHA